MHALEALIQDLQDAVKAMKTQIRGEGAGGIQQKQDDDASASKM